MAITVTATAELDTIPPRVRLDVLSTGTGTTAVTVARLDEDGSTSPVRTADGLPLQLTASGSDMTGLLYDVEIPYSTTAQYGTVEAGISSDPVFLFQDRVWLIHPGVPTRSVMIRLRPGSLKEIARPVQRGVFLPIGRRNPVVVSDGQRKGGSGQLVALTDNPTDHSRLLALLDDAAPLLLNIPPTLGYNFPTCYIAVGDASENRLFDVLTDVNRDVVMSFSVVDRPAGGSQAARTWVDVMAENATWAEVLANYATWADLLAPTT